MSEAELIKRLERLERDNRRLKRIALVAVVLLGSVVALGAAYTKPAIPKKIVAHEFDVVDGSGKVRIRLSTQKNGWAGVQVLDTAGVAQAVMADSAWIGPSVELGLHKVTHALPGLPRGWMTPDINIGDMPHFGPMITLTLPGAQAGPAVGMGVTLKGQPGVTLLDSKGRDRADVSLLHSGEPSLKFYGEDGRETVKLMSCAGVGDLEFIGSQNQKMGKYSFPVDRVQLTKWGLYFNDKHGNTTIQLGGPARDGTTKPFISLTDPQGFEMDLGSTSEIVPTTGATTQTSADSIVMFGNDKKHHVIWQAPQ